MTIAKSAAAPEKRLMPMGEKVRRITLLDQACGFIGQAEVAKALNIEPRSLRNKLSADRGVTNADLLLAAEAVHVRAVLMLAHVVQIKDVVAP